MVMNFAQYLVPNTAAKEAWDRDLVASEGARQRKLEREKMAADMLHQRQLEAQERARQALAAQQNEQAAVRAEQQRQEALARWKAEQSIGVIREPSNPAGGIAYPNKPTALEMIRSIGRPAPAPPAASPSGMPAPGSLPTAVSGPPEPTEQSGGAGGGLGGPTVPNTARVMTPWRAPAAATPSATNPLAEGMGMVDRLFPGAQPAQEPETPLPQARPGWVFVDQTLPDVGVARVMDTDGNNVRDLPLSSIQQGAQEGQTVPLVSQGPAAPGMTTNTAKTMIPGRAPLVAPPSQETPKTPNTALVIQTPSGPLTFEDRKGEDRANATTGEVMRQIRLYDGTLPADKRLTPEQFEQISQATPELWKSMNYDTKKTIDTMLQGARDMAKANWRKKPAGGGRAKVSPDASYEEAIAGLDAKAAKEVEMSLDRSAKLVLGTDQSKKSIETYNLAKQAWNGMNSNDSGAQRGALWAFAKALNGGRLTDQDIAAMYKFGGEWDKLQTYARGWFAADNPDGMPGEALSQYGTLSPGLRSAMKSAAKNLLQRSKGELEETQNKMVEYASKRPIIIKYLGDKAGQAAAGYLKVTATVPQPPEEPSNKAGSTAKPGQSIEEKWGIK